MLGEMENQRATSRYAKACQDCATTKARCIRQDHARKCERCTRLNKECKARVSASRAPRVSKPNRLTQMEQKLDGLVTLLVATQSQRQPLVISDSAPPMTPNSLSPDAMPVQLDPIQLPFVPGVSLQEKAKIYPNPGEPITNRGDNITGNANMWPKCHITEGENTIPSLDLNDETSQALLDNYQAVMARYFPFVIIPASTTATDLRTSKPFLFLTVMAVSSYQRTGQQTSLSMEIMRSLSDQMLIKGEKSMDLLQGILVYIEWYQSHRLIDPQLTNILHLSSALLVDLGLNKAPYTSDNQNQMATDTTELLHGRAIQRVRSNDERRAFLGNFYLSSAISSCFKKVDALRYTAHVEESCSVLSQHPEYESDRHLVQLVRLQSIAEQITQTLPYDLPQSLWTTGTSIKLLVNAFYRELQCFQASLPHSLKQDPLIQAHIQNAEIHLFEISLGDWPRQASPLTSLNSPTHRLEILHQTLLATSTLLTSFLALPNDQYSTFPFVMWGQCVHAMQVLSKLSLLTDVPGWSLAHVQAVMDFPSFLDRLCAKLNEQRQVEEAIQRSLDGPQGSRYEIYASRLTRVKAWYDIKLRSQQRGGSGGGAQSHSSMASVLAGHDADRDVESDLYGVMGGRAQPGGLPRQVPGSGGVDGLRDELLTLEMMEQMDDAYWHEFLAEWACL